MARSHPGHGKIRPYLSEKNLTFAEADEDDLLRELRVKLQQIIEEHLRQDQEIEDEIRVQSDKLIKSGKNVTVSQNDHPDSKEERLKRLRHMRAMVVGKGETIIRDLRQWIDDEVLLIDGPNSGLIEVEASFNRFPKVYERNPMFAVPDEDWVRELREELQRNMEERLREQEKEIEDEIQVQINGAIKSGKLSAEGRKDQLSRLRYAKEQRLRRMRAMLMEEGEARIREERTLRQWSVDGGFPTGDSDFAEVFKREQQDLMDKLAKDGRNSTSSSPVAERQQAQSSSPPPAGSVTSKPPGTMRSSAPRIAHTQSSQAYQQQERKTSQQFIWKPPVQPSETGHPRKSSISANASAGLSTPGAIASSSARRHIGVKTSYAPTTAYPSQYNSVQPSVPAPTPSSYSSPFSNTQNKPQLTSPWQAELTSGYFYDDPEDISETEDESAQDSNSDADDDGYSEEEVPVPNQARQESLRGLPPKSSPRIVQGDQDRGRGLGGRLTMLSQYHYRSRNDSGGNASRNVERYDPQNSGAPQLAAAFETPPSNVTSQRQAEPIRPSSPKYEDSYSSDAFESDFSYDSQPSAVPMSRQPTGEILPESGERDRFRPRNMDNNRRDDNPSTNTKSRDKASIDKAESSTSQRPSALEERKAEELRQREKEIAQREEALARREEEDRRRRENKAKLRELRKAERERVKEKRSKESETARNQLREEEEKKEQRRKEEEKAMEIERENELIIRGQELKDRVDAEKLQREEEARARTEDKLWNEAKGEREERVRREQERKDREQAELMQREEEARARTQDKLWNEAKERNARQNPLVVDKPTNASSFAATTSSTNSAHRTVPASGSSSQSSYSTWAASRDSFITSSVMTTPVAPQPARRSNMKARAMTPTARNCASGSTMPHASSVRDRKT